MTSTSTTQACITSRELEECSTKSDLWFWCGCQSKFSRFPNQQIHHHPQIWTRCNFLKYHWGMVQFLESELKTSVGENQEATHFGVIYDFTHSYWLLSFFNLLAASLALIYFNFLVWLWNWDPKLHISPKCLNQAQAFSPVTVPQTSNRSISGASLVARWTQCCLIHAFTRQTHKIYYKPSTIDTYLH